MYITMRNIFLIPNDAIDRRKLGIQLLFLILAVKGPTWTIVYFLKFIVLNYTDFHKILVLTSSNLPTKLQAKLPFFNRIESLDDVPS